MRSVYIMASLSLVMSAAALLLCVITYWRVNTVATLVSVSAGEDRGKSGAAGTKTTAAKASPPPGGNAAAAPIVPQKRLEALVEKKVAKEIDNLDLKDAIDSNLEKKLKKGYSPNHGEMLGKEIDVSGIADTEEKIKKILEVFEGVNSYMSPNAHVKQMAALGDEAIEPLLKELASVGSDHANWAKRQAVNEALNKLLTRAHKDVILENFEKNGSLLELVKKYNFPEAEELVFKRIKDNDMSAGGGHMQNAQGYFDVALQMDKERAIQAMQEYVNDRATSENSHNLIYPLKKLSDMNVDITEPLREAAINVHSVWEKSELSPLLLRNGMSEGFALAVSVLRDTGEHADYAKQQMADKLRILTDAKGDYKEMADWLERNAKLLKWSPSTKRFE